MKKAVIYARYSSHSQRDESIDAQLRECHEYAARNDYIVLEEYCDRALTGKTDNRAGFQKMIKDAKNNKFNYVLVYKLDRFARNRYDSAMYKNALKKHNVKVVSIKENIADSPEGIILESVLEGMAEYYSANLSQNIKRGMTENALQCKYNGSGCPLGFRITPEKNFAVDEMGAKIVNEIFTMYASGKNSAEIINHCNDKGYKTSKGQAFNKNSVSRILTNEKYIGTYRHGDIVIENGIPSIVDKVLFDKVQTMFKKNYKTRARGKAQVDYLLSGKIFCGHCREHMFGESGTSKTGKKHYYYKCSSRKVKHNCDKEVENKDWLENVVIKLTLEQVLTDENIEMIATKAMELVEADASDTSEIKYYEDELKNTQKQIKNIVDMVANGMANKSIADRLTELEEYEKDVISNLEYAKMKKPNLTKEQIMYWLESFRYGDIDDVEYKRKIVNTLIHSVYVYDTDGGGKRRIVVNFNTSANNHAEVECSDTDFLFHQRASIRTPLYILSYAMFSYLAEIDKSQV
jgi:DNA invertase Pin-like site-specific DNA recombinase